MKSRLQRFLMIAAAFAAYTALKAVQIWPNHTVAAAVSALVLFAIMISGMFVYRSNPVVFEQGWFRALSWAGSLMMALWSTFILASIPVDLLHLVVWAVARLTHGQTPSLHGLYVAIFWASFSLMALGFLEVLRGPKVKRISVTFAGLPASLAGLRIVQISDLHVGPTIRKGYVADVVRRVNAEKPDLIFFTGDLADAHVSSIAEHLQPLAQLKPRYGSFFVTGNHEYYWNADAILDKMKALGFTPLLNQNSMLKVGASNLMVAGVTDPAGEMLAGHTPDTTQALMNAVKADFKILLAHRPDACIEAETVGIDLQFSGHTHAGQFFPFSLLIGLFHQYSRGLYKHGRMWLYVNPGTGYWGPADRLGVRSEISAITLTPA